MKGMKRLFGASISLSRNWEKGKSREYTPETNYEKYSRLVSNNPELKEKEIKYIEDYKDVNPENKCVEHFMADKIYCIRNENGENNKCGWRNYFGTGSVFERKESVAVFFSQYHIEGHFICRKICERLERGDKKCLK